MTRLPGCLAFDDIERWGSAPAARVEEMMKWQPIETAPRVTRVLVTCAGGEIVDIARQTHQGNGKWVWITDDNESEESGYFEDGEATHWMPLPEPPNARRKSGDPG